MKVLMLGWEYPPHISGGLGTACEGLTVGLARQGAEISFVVPHFFGGEIAPHMQLLDSRGKVATEAAESKDTELVASESSPLKGSVRSIKIPALLSPYWTPESYRQFITSLQAQRAKGALLSREQLPPEVVEFLSSSESEVVGADRYGHDIFAEVARFAANVVARFGMQDFDVIHAHDWMTYPAGVSLAQLTGKPLIVHVHSLEFDRSGAGKNEQICQIEKWGLEAAAQVVAVSYYTRGLIHQQHGIPLERIAVVHNGVYPHQVVQSYRHEHNLPSKVVLFLGRITFQKGPDYFVEAAAKVIPYIPDVVFVMAGAGDMLQRMIDRVNQLGISRHFFFPGFLKGQEVEQMFSLADVYVMPSVSEPFGISALEAINYDTPVIISKQSGVAEVLGHALKVDFWDIDRLADLIINALLHDELRQDMVSMAREEVKRLHWDAAALKTIDIYRALLQ